MTMPEQKSWLGFWFLCWSLSTIAILLYAINMDEGLGGIFDPKWKQGLFPEEKRERHLEKA